MKRALSLSAVALLLSAVTAQTRITTASGGGERQPVISADGTVIAYVAFVGNVREVFTISPNGGTPARLTTNAEVRIGATTVFDAWPSLSISDNGRRIAYWNAGGVHVLDTVNNTDVVVDAAANVLAYPQISGDGRQVAYQARVAGAFEVFVASTTGGTPTQISTASGAGRRLPHLRGNRVVFQRLVGNFQEVFLYDLTTSTTQGPLSSNGGRGNRYARLDHDATDFVYEALLLPASIKEVFTYEIATSTRRQVTSGSLRGDRLAVPTLDGEAFYEFGPTNREVQKIDVATSAAQALTTNTRAGYRRISVDRHGTVAVYQGEQVLGSQLGNTEVFVVRLCYAPTLSTFGTAGVPSVGTLTAGLSQYRCDLVASLETSLPGGSIAIAMLGMRQTALPLPGAPGNHLYIEPFTYPFLPLATSLNGAGDVALTLPSPVGLSGADVYLQWGVVDPAANSLGIVMSAAIRGQLQ